MRVLLQRVNRASVTVSGEVTGAIERGLLLLVGFGQNDTSAAFKPMAQKLANLRVFPQDKSHFNLSLLDIKGGALLVPQFTLYAETSKGRRPDFTSALKPDSAKVLFDEFVGVMRGMGITPLAQGVFGAYMHVSLENDGPVTIMLES